MTIAVAMTTKRLVIMASDEEKCKIAKLLQRLEISEMKIPERSQGLVKEFEQKFGSEIEIDDMDSVEYKNPYVPDKQLLEENERKLRELLAQSKRERNAAQDNVLSGTDPNRPWRIQSSKEKLLRIDSELKRHSERRFQPIVPMTEGAMQELVDECRQETSVAPPVGADRLRDTVNEARKHLTSFQYRKIENTTATAIDSDAHHNSAVPQVDVPHQLYFN